jgi:hypothetical protein
MEKESGFGPGPYSANSCAGGVIASLVETCKLNGVDPQAYFADVLTRLVHLWPTARLATSHRMASSGCAMPTGAGS